MLRSLMAYDVMLHDVDPLRRLHVSFGGVLAHEAFTGEMCSL